MMCWQTLALWNVRPGPSALHLMRLCRADDTRVPLLDQKAPERIHHGVSALCFAQRSGANMFQSRAERSGGPRRREPCMAAGWGEKPVLSSFCSCPRHHPFHAHACSLSTGGRPAGRAAGHLTCTSVPSHPGVSTVESGLLASSYHDLSFTQDVVRDFPF
jgi:hypothetical protein